MSETHTRKLAARREGFQVLAVALILTWWLDETPGELVWGYWLSWLFIPIVFTVCLAIGRIRQGRLSVSDYFTGAITLGILGGTLFIFHRGYGEILSGFYPIRPDPGRIYLGHLTWTNSRSFDYWPDFVHAAKEYYWIAVLSLWAVRAIILDELKGVDPSPSSPEAENFFLFMFRMMMLVFVLIGVEIALQIAFGENRPNVNHFAYAVLIQFVAYYPVPASPRTRPPA
jgi:hypothetical protein